jgi:hypothetical protein
VPNEYSPFVAAVISYTLPILPLFLAIGKAFGVRLEGI